MNNIKLFYINLNHKINRRKIIENEMNNLNINFQRIEAYNEIPDNIIIGNVKYNYILDDIKNKFYVVYHILKLY